jgi:hypothetical protein
MVALVCVNGELVLTSTVSKCPYFAVDLTRTLLDNAVVRFKGTSSVILMEMAPNERSENGRMLGLATA